jgi:hypothetical protein
VNPFVRLPLCPFTVTVTVTAPALPAGVVAVMVVLLTTTTLVAAVPPNVTVAPAAKFVPVIVTAVPPDTVPVIGDKLATSGEPGFEDVDFNATACMIHPPAGLTGALAVYCPAVVELASSTMSPSGVVIIREVKPLPGPVVPVRT